MRRVLGWAVTIALLGVWAVTLRPVTFGGPTSIVGVHGVSMTPAMQDGDLAVTRTQRSYRVGDVIAYRVPAGEPGAGSNVIHRIVGGDGETGYVLQGDHNTWTDTWRPRNSDVIGKVWLHVPSGVRVINALKSPRVLAVLLGILVFACIVWPSKADEGPEQG